MSETAVKDTVTIVEFLNARLDEDEAKLDLAAEAEAESLRHDGMPDTTAQEIKDYWLSLGRETEWPRWLAEIAAKRTIVEVTERWMAAGYPTLDVQLRILASIYSDHPDYRQEWKP